MGKGYSYCRQRYLAAIIFLIAVLGACRPDKPDTYPTQVVEYDLGDTTIIQDQFPDDSNFRNMPVRLDGIIGVPERDLQHPVVLIMHGSHASCPGENEWPCSPEEEQKNYEGFDYLVEALAEAGYIALSINVNAEHTFGFGEAPPTTRTRQLIDLHLAELAAASAGESNKFGLDLTGKVDLERMTWIGHSRGGEFANRILLDPQGAFGGVFKEVQGLIQIAPSLVFADSLPAAEQAMATILPACDQDVLNLYGQRYYESARFDPERVQFSTTVYLYGADHNSFNALLEPESLEVPANRPDCEADHVLEPKEQQAFLAQYVIDFLRAIYSTQAQAQDAKQRLGISTDISTTDQLYGEAVMTNFLPAQQDTLLLVKPESEEELHLNLLGGDVRLDGVTEYYCPDGYYVPAAEPGSEPCKRVNFNQPGFPQQLVLNWENGDARWSTSIPSSNSDFSEFQDLQLRVALDPLSELNTEDQPQSFTIELVDAKNQRAGAAVAPIEYPAGVRRPNHYFEGDSFSGHVFMNTYRIPLEEFNGIELSSISDVVLLFDQTDSGTLFVADIELLGSN